MICLRCVLDAELLDRPRSFKQHGLCDYCDRLAFLTALPSLDQPTERQAIMRFARRMATKTAERKARYDAFGWRGRTIEYLFNWLIGEIIELVEGLERGEAVDVGNLIFMIDDKLSVLNGGEMNEARQQLQPLLKQLRKIYKPRDRS